MKVSDGNKMGTQGDWLIPFKRREFSGTFDYNFLWRWNNVYVMDNHRIALWCWLRHFDSTDVLNILHLDQHYDCLQSFHTEWVAALPSNIDKLTLEDYLNFQWNNHHEKYPLFRYDNYFSLFMSKYGEHINEVYISTHQDGDRPSFEFVEFSILQSMGYLNARCNPMDNFKTILNIDIDYFTETGFDRPITIVSKSFLHKLGELIREGIDTGAIRCLTLALSPEFAGSWEIAEEVTGEIFEAAQIPFSLPR